MQVFLQSRLCVQLLYLIVLLGCVVAFVFVYLSVTEDQVIDIPRSKRVVNLTTVKPKTINNLSCYNADDNLPKSDENFSPVDGKSIFFFGSCFGNLTMLQACAVESAARSHPKRNVYILFSSGVRKISSNSFIEELLQYTNVQIARIPVHEYVKDALLETVIINDSKKNIRPEDFSNILRIVILNKWGGIFIEDDMLVFRSFESLPRNWVAKEDVNISPRILAFGDDEVGWKITNQIIEEISKTYFAEFEQFNLSNTITRVFERMCINELFTKGTINCTGATVYPRDLFYPINYSKDVFEIDDSDVDVGNQNIPYTYHHLMKLRDYNSVEETEDQPILKLASKFCPYVFQSYELIEHTEPIE